jgi:hypothetical protein
MMSSGHSYHHVRTAHAVEPWAQSVVGFLTSRRVRERDPVPSTAV